MVRLARPAGVAQLVEQLIRNQQVIGSSPIAGSKIPSEKRRIDDVPRWDDDHLVFANIRSPGTLGNLRQNANVEVNVVELVRKSYRFKGVASILESGPFYEKLVASTESEVRRCPSSFERFVMIRVQTAQPVDSPAYDVGLTETWSGTVLPITSDRKDDLAHRRVMAASLPLMFTEGRLTTACTDGWWHSEPPRLKRRR